MKLISAIIGIRRKTKEDQIERPRELGGFTILPEFEEPQGRENT
jgi:hypothetical protein